MTNFKRSISHYMANYEYSRGTNLPYSLLARAVGAFSVGIASWEVAHDIPVNSETFIVTAAIAGASAVADQMTNSNSRLRQVLNRTGVSGKID